MRFYSVWPPGHTFFYVGGGADEDIEKQKKKETYKNTKYKEERKVFKKMDSLFGYDVAGKIRLLAKIAFIIEVIACIIVGIAIWDDWDYQWLLSIAVIVGGSLTAYIGCIVAYGFASIIENTEKIAHKE